MTSKQYDIAVIGGGIVGTATAMALAKQKNISIVILEAESKLAAHQTGNNSGVIHSGLYYKPGSLKANNCVTGRKALYKFCEEHDIAHDQCGKVVVATDEKEIPKLNDLESRGHANGLVGLKRLKPEEIKEYEPHVTGIDGLYVPETGIVDYNQVTEKFAEIVQQQGGQVELNARVIGFKKETDGLVLETT
ncbi:MAG TPA: FAD-dependent oxidoreductase, partial [Caldithrix sp.]|nr:FAD-dependent oxidoreductase [Caldithrix sp.]